VSDFSFRNVPDVYTELGVDTTRMGCIMLDLESLPNYMRLPEVYGFYDDEMPWVKGFEPADKPHVTLLYGLLENGTANRHLVDAVLDGWEPSETLTVDRVQFFPTPADVPYRPMVLRLDEASHEIALDAHHRLSLLPHIDTFPGYKSHITVGYVRKDMISDAPDEPTPYGPFDLQVRGLNYGD
jgi:hypothetical protein